MSFNSLKEKAQKINSIGGVAFMEGRDKGELPQETICTLEDYGYIKGDAGTEYAVMALTEYPKHFFFGGQVVTEKFRELDLVITDEEREQIREDGIPVLFLKKKNKKGKREYTTCEFFPEETEE